MPETMENLCIKIQIGDFPLVCGQALQGLCVAGISANMWFWS